MTANRAIILALRAVILALLLLGAAATASAQSRNPFGSSGSGTLAAPAPERGGEAPGFFARVAQQITVWQRQVIDRLAQDIRAYKDSGALGPALAILFVSFLYGVFHAVGPGHGKVVTASYFTANRAGFAQGLAMTGMISAVQAISAVAIVGVLAVFFSFGPTRVVHNVSYVEAASHVLIVMVGLYIAWGGLIGRGCSHDHGRRHEHAYSHDHAHPHDRSHQAAPTAGFWSMASAAVSAGIRPCTGAILVLLFTLSHGIFEVGVLSAFVMALGVFLVLAALGAGVIYARRTVGRAGGGRPRLANFAHRAAGIAGGSIIVAFGALLFFESLSGLGVTL